MKTFTSRRLASFLAAALLAVIPLVHQAAEAGSIGRPSSSSSVSRSAPSSRPAAAPSPSRIGGSSQSVGMSRPELARPAPAPQQSIARSRAPRPVPAPAYQQPRYQQPMPVTQQSYAEPGRQGPGWGTVAAAGLGGALAGHLLTERSHGGAAAPGYAGGVAPLAAAPAAAGGGVAAAAVDPTTGAIVSAPAAMSVGQPYLMAAAPKDNFASNWIAFCFGIVMLGALALMGAVMWRKSKRPRASASMRPSTTYADSEFDAQAMTADLPFSPMAQFWDIQRAHSGADHAALRRLLGPDLVDEMVMNATTISPMTLSGVSYVVVDDGGNSGIVTVQYTFFDAGERVVQNWHYIEPRDAAGVWVLNGIDTV